MRKAKKEKKNPNDSMVKVYTGEMLRQILQTHYNVPLSVKFVNFLLLMTKNYIHYTCWPTSFIRNLYKGLVMAVFCFI